MKTITLDFETYYDTDYSLKKMTTEEYVRDPRFEALCMAVKPFGEEGYVETGTHIDDFLACQDWSDVAVIMHHAHFDGFILSERYNVHPTFFFDTLSMARAVNGPLDRASLDSLAARYGLPHKTVPYNKFRGRRWEHMDDALRTELCEGTLHDAKLTETIFRKLIEGFPKDELAIIDTTVRMYTNPQICGDANLFERIALEEQTRKAQTLTELGVKESELQSSATLLRILSGLGEDVPLKTGKDGPVPCFASSDDYMLDNQGRDGAVGKLLRARLDVKSTLMETRASRLAAMARRGPMPVYHKYCAAVTTRWGGGEKVNIQNLPRSGDMRSGLMAPEGKVFVIVDFSQIEYRILCALAGQTDKLEALAAGRDLYRELGEQLFLREITKDERQFAKKVVLGCGYGTGKDKLAGTAKSDGFNFPRSVTDSAIILYRHTHPEVVTLWLRCNKLLPCLAAGKKENIDGTPLQFDNGCLILPNGLTPRFNLVYCDDGLARGWYRRTSRGEPGVEGDNMKTLVAKGYTSYWGGGLVEFCCQALARVRLSELILKAKSRLGISPVFLVHDEYVCLVEESVAASILDCLLEMACEPSSWWENGPPFAAEGSISARYHK